MKIFEREKMYIKPGTLDGINIVDVYASSDAVILGNIFHNIEYFVLKENSMYNALHIRYYITINCNFVEKFSKFSYFSYFSSSFWNKFLK